MEQGRGVDGEFLREHRITSDELGTLEAIGTMLVGLSKSNADIRVALAMKGIGMSEQQVALFLAGRQLPRAAKRVAAAINNL